MRGAGPTPSKRELLQWSSSLLRMDLQTLDDFISGAVWCQLLDACCETVPIRRVDFFAHTYEQCVLNYKVLQQLFNNMSIERNIDVKEMLEGHQSTLLEFLQWMYRYVSERGVRPGYDPTARRRMSKHGGCERIPRFGASEAAFKRWSMKEGLRADYDLGAYPAGQVPFRPVELTRPQQPRFSTAGRPARDSITGSTTPTRRGSHTGSSTPSFRPSQPGSARAAAASSARRNVFGTAARPKNGSSTAKGGKASNAATLRASLAAADVAVQLVAEHTGLLAGVTGQLGAARAVADGGLNVCIARGALRSLRDVLATLTRHARLLLDDCRLRAEAWSEPEGRNKAARLDTSLAAAERQLRSAAEQLTDTEVQLGPPETGVAGQPYAALANVAKATAELTEALRGVGGAAADSPMLWPKGSGPTPQQAARLTLPPLGQGVMMELRAAPEFLNTSTSHACKVGPFQYRRLRNGDVYKGRYSRSKKSGDGAYAFMNGDAYEGEFRHDHMEGHGVYTFSGQGRYEGAWASAHYSGHGAETFARGSTYAGEYVGGNRAGAGVCRYYNGDYYEGAWAEGVRSGLGMQQCVDGSNYVGEYKDAKREGLGVYTFHNGDCYLGQYRADLPNGLGVYLFDRGQQYMGEWQHGKKHGLCEYIVESGERYVGEWDSGKPQWVQSLSGADGSGVIPDVSPDMQAKVDAALQVAQRARNAAGDSRHVASDHWDPQRPPQQAITAALKGAAAAAESAQAARRRALALAVALEATIYEHLGGKDWPNPEDLSHIRGGAA